MRPTKMVSLHWRSAGYLFAQTMELAPKRSLQHHLALSRSGTSILAHFWLPSGVF